MVEGLVVELEDFREIIVVEGGARSRIDFNYWRVSYQLMVADDDGEWR
jgi:hypothetical protein